MKKKIGRGESKGGDETKGMRKHPQMAGHTERCVADIAGKLI